MTEAGLRRHLGAVSDCLRHAALDTDWINDALVLARLMGRLQWDNISGHFGDDAFEAALFERWGADIARQAETEPVLLPALDVLHVATQIYEGGGHSRLLRQLVAGMAPNGTQGLILRGKGATGQAGLPDQIAQTTGRPSQRAAQIVACGRRAGAVLLHHHPDDMTVALAARVLRAEGIRVLFVNHADHVFSFGPGAADVVLEICATGWTTTATRRSPHAQSFMGIPILPADATLPAILPPRDGPIVTMGGPGKFRPDAELSFPNFLMDLLPRVPNPVILIGPKRSDPWWAPVVEAFPDRISLRGTLPPAEVAEIMKTASCYIDSFPMDGGTAFPQAVCQGPPGFGPNAQNALGGSPADTLRLNSVAELGDVVVAYLQGGPYPFDLDGVRAETLAAFSDRAVADRVLRAIDGALTELPEALRQNGRRDSDYNARRWAETGDLHLPKRIWRQLSVNARRDLHRVFSTADLPTQTKRQLKKRLILG